MTSRQINIELQKNQGILKNIAYKFTKDPEEIQELVQETMVRSLGYLDKFINNPKLVAWLYVIMKNVYINQYRRMQKRNQYESFQVFSFKNDGCQEPVSANTVDGKFVTDDIATAMDKLPKENAELFLRYLEGYKYRELAEQFDMPQGTVKTRIHCTRKFLQKHLAVYKKVG